MSLWNSTSAIAETFPADLLHDFIPALRDAPRLQPSVIGEPGVSEMIFAEVASHRAAQVRARRHGSADAHGLTDQRLHRCIRRPHGCTALSPPQRLALR